LLQEDEDMTMKSRLVSFFAAGMLVSTVAAHAQVATVPDPNLAPSTSDAEAGLPASPANSPELAADPDTNLAPSTADAEAELPPSAADSPELADVPDPNVSPSTEEAETRSALTAPSDAPEAVQR
jgi:hypothetical protein